jgi:ABC-type uncharacterized transport system permease subunit
MGGGIVAAALGVPIAVFGFLVMRNPMRLSLLAPREKGYYQRAFFDSSSRNSTRGFGALLCLFGVSIATDGAGNAFKSSYLHAAATGIWILMSMTFASLFCFGVGLAIWRVVRGKSLGWSDWFLMRQRGIELGPIDVFPQITPQMQKEARVFTIGLIILTCIAAAAAMLR